MQDTNQQKLSLLQRLFANISSPAVSRSVKGVMFVLAISVCGVAIAQKPYFVDGYHGGVYGHYPLEWKTRFITSSLEKYPEWRISLEIEPETWDSVAVRTPADYERMKSWAVSPRVEFTNPTYAQPYCYNISGESLIRQFSYGIKKIRSHFPDVEFVTYAVEEPCFTSSLPQILKLFGYKYATLKCPNTCWGGYAAPYGGETVNWIGPDGSSILTSPRYECEALAKNSVWQTTAWGNQDHYIRACREAGIKHPIGMCLQDAGWKNGPWLGYGDKMRHPSQYVTWREYFEMLDLEKGAEDYHFSQEEVRPALMWGSQVLQRLAQQVRHSENVIPMAEKFSAMASLLDDGYVVPQADLDEAWRTLMLAQHHDSWIVPYNGLHRKGTWADWIARWTAISDSNALNVIKGAQQAMAGEELVAGDKASLRVWNTQGVARHEVVTVEIPEAWRGYNVAVSNIEGEIVESFADMTQLLFVANAPAFGYTTYRLQRLDEKVVVEEEHEGSTIENDLYRISVDASRGGVISELVVKQGDEAFDYVDKAAEYGMGELCGYFYHQRVFRSSTEEPARVRVGRRGDFEQWLIIEGTIASHPFTQRITIRKGSADIDVYLTIDWQHDEGIGEYYQRNAHTANRRAFYDDRFKLNMMFPTTLGKVVLDKNAPFDVCRSQLENTYFNTWDNIKHNILLHWVDVAQDKENGRGLALMTDHTTSYRYGQDDALGLTVQYSGAGLWGRRYPISGKTSMHCALVPHKGFWDDAELEQVRANRGEPLSCSLHKDADMERKSMLSVEGSAYEVVAVYPVEQGWIVRLYNAAGDDTSHSVVLGQNVEKVAEIDLNENILQYHNLKNGKSEASVDIAIPRFGLKTLLIYRKE